MTSARKLKTDPEKLAKKLARKEKLTSGPQTAQLKNKKEEVARDKSERPGRTHQKG